MDTLLWALPTIPLLGIFCKQLVVDQKGTMNTTTIPLTNWFGFFILLLGIFLSFSFEDIFGISCTYFDGPSKSQLQDFNYSFSNILLLL